MNNEKDITLNYWNDVWNKYKDVNVGYENWLDEFNAVIENSEKPIIDLGCGLGNNTKFLIEKGKKVIACDLSNHAINMIKNKFPNIYDTKCFNMIDGLPFKDNSCDLVIADLCLHYFSSNDTMKIFNDIERILVKGGHLIFRVNSIYDTNFDAGNGEEVEKNLYRISDGRLKRFFTKEDIEHFCNNLSIDSIEFKEIKRLNASNDKEEVKRVYVVCAVN